MGLDILIRTDKDDQLFTADYHDPKHDNFNKHSLSRTFCNLMSRQHVVDGEPELNQIGTLTSVDISPLYQMETYKEDNDEEMEFHLETAENEDERQQILQEAKQSRENLKGNIDRVLATINQLIETLSSTDNLIESLKDSGHDTLGYKEYFTDFNVNKGEGYIGNNFGQDLRNFKSFLDYAKSQGASTVYFRYG